MRRVLFLLTAALAPLQAMPMNDSDFTFSPPPPPKPSVMGLQFGTSPKDVTAFMSAFSKEEGRPKELDGGRVSVLTFRSVPDGLPIDATGSSHFFFYNNQLAKVVFSFAPSYESFLVLRTELTESLNDRYILGQRHEVMDNHLRQHLAQLGPNSGSLGGSAEKAIQASIEEGKTFFSYTWNDQQKELDISLNYSRSTNTRIPTLALHYDYMPLVELMQQPQQHTTTGESSLAPQQ